MRHALALTATLAALAWAAPASAQMCGGSPSATGATASGSGMMCGMMGRPAASSDLIAAPSQQQGHQRAGGCPCCRNMAMMQGGMGGMMGGGSGGSSGGMGGMQMPSQPSTPQATPGAPETPQTPRPQ